MPVATPTTAKAPRPRSGDALLFLLVFLFAPYAAQRFKSSNEIGRLGLSHALATRGVLTIDAVAPYTIDKARRGEHFYCDKAPGVSLLCVPAVAVADALADALGLAPELFSPPKRPTPRYALCGYACLLSSVAWIYALSVVLFRRCLQAARVEPRAATLVTLLFAFGTPPLLWSTTLFGHTAATGLLLSGFALGFIALNRGEPARATATWCLSGLALGGAVISEFTALPPAALLAAFLVFVPAPPGFPSAARRAGSLAVGALGPALVLFAYNTLAFEHPFKLGYASVQGFEGMQTGFFGVSAPKLSVAYELLFGAYRGLFGLSPVLLPALIVCIASLPRAGVARATAMLALMVFTYYVCLNAGYHYWDGGSSTGPRHITPVAPLLMLGLGLAWPQLSRLARALTSAVGLLSVSVTTTCALVRVTAPGDGSDVLRTHIVPRLLQGQGLLLPQRLGLSNALSIALAFALLAAASYALLQRRSNA